MNNKQVLVYGLLESTSDWGSVFVGHIHFKKLMNFENLLKYFTVAWPGSGTENKISFIDKNHFKKEKYGTNMRYGDSGKI